MPFPQSHIAFSTLVFLPVWNYSVSFNLYIRKVCNIYFSLNPLLMIKTLKTSVCFLLCFACLLLPSCRQHTQVSSAQKHVNTALSPLLKKLQGSWICYDYLRSLKATHSPIRSSAYIDAVLSFVADSNTISNDTLYLNALIKGHEDNSLWIALAKPDSTGCYPAGQARTTDNESSPLDLIVKARIDSSFVTLYTAGSDSLKYVYSDPVYKGRPGDHLLRYHTTNVLFHGEYTTRDSAMIFGSSHIVFDPDHLGRLTGSPVYDSFDINVDVLAQKDTLDYIEFYDTKKRAESHSYTYRIQDNKINIYSLNDGAACRLQKEENSDH